MISLEIMNSVPGAPILTGVSCSTELPELHLPEKSKKFNDPSLKGISANLEAMKLMGVPNTNAKSPTSFTGKDEEALKLLR